MNLLLDTHIFLWYISGDEHLPASHLAAIRDPANAVYLSAASVWEAVIKHSIGKLSFYGFTLVSLDSSILAYPVTNLSKA
jgi:PIN domain nuclease of toxin-antitoxin system